MIAAKHQSFLETFALLKYAPDFAIVLKRQLTLVPLFGLYLSFQSRSQLTAAEDDRRCNKSSPLQGPFWLPVGTFLSIRKAHDACREPSPNTEQESLRSTPRPERRVCQSRSIQGCSGGDVDFSGARGWRLSNICLLLNQD